MRSHSQVQPFSRWSWRHSSSLRGSPIGGRGDMTHELVDVLVVEVTHAARGTHGRVEQTVDGDGFARRTDQFLRVARATGLRHQTYRRSSTENSCCCNEKSWWMTPHGTHSSHGHWPDR